MNVTGLVFSRDRAAQLDLLLASLETNAPGFLETTWVLWVASNREYGEGYAHCISEYPQVRFQYESEFNKQLGSLLDYTSPLVCFFCDDDVLYRPLDVLPQPETLLEQDADIFSVNLRLGRNAIECYPLRSTQAQPLFQ